MYQQIRKRLSLHLTHHLRNSDSEAVLLPKVTNPTPFYVSNSMLNKWNKLHATLHTSIKNIMYNFNHDADVQTILNLSPKELSIINNCNNKQQFHSHYNIGSFRPDLLIEEKTQQTKICEINARFAINGFMSSLCLSQSLSETNPSFKRYNYPKYNSLYDQHFDYTKPIFIIKGKEYGSSIYLYKSFNSQVHIININHVLFNDKTRQLYTYINNEWIQIQQIILELHQCEILSLSNNILETFCVMCANQTLLNDFRTIFIVHNKKLLNILSKEYIMKRYINSKDFKFLNNFLLKSYCKFDIINNNKLLNKIIENRHKFILKPTLLGKGEGIIFGDECNINEWNLNINNLVINSNEYIIQEYIFQELFEYFSIIKNEIVHQNMIPSILCYNNQFYGPAIIRSSPRRLIAVSRGGEILLPQIMDYIPYNFMIPQTDFNNNNISFDYFDGKIFEYNKKENIKSLSDKVMNILKTENKCLINNINIDKDSLIMQQIVNEIGVAHIHDKNGNILWDVKVMNGIARSHNNKEFELHSDASFEEIVPRYFGLHVLNEDKLNGGLNQLISVNDEIINKLTQYEINQLMKCKFKIKIPFEFMKDNDLKYNFGYLLSFDRILNKYIMRYRKDIICRNDLNEKQNMLLNRLEKVLMECQNNAKLIKIPENSILFVDNCCYLHSRTNIKDYNRHLRRIRFHPKQYNLIPNFQ